MEEKLKAIELVKGLHKYLDERDSYWNVTDDCKETAKISIDIISDGSKFWQDVKNEIDKLPYYIEDLET